VEAAHDEAFAVGEGDGDFSLGPQLAVDGGSSDVTERDNDCSGCMSTRRRLSWRVGGEVSPNGVV
jgi:hypothetical protein